MDTGESASIFVLRETEGYNPVMESEHRGHTIRAEALKTVVAENDLWRPKLWIDGGVLSYLSLRTRQKHSTMKKTPLSTLRNTGNG
jgi:hypothetical protein